MMLAPFFSDGIRIHTTSIKSQEEGLCVNMQKKFKKKKKKRAQPPHPPGEEEGLACEIWDLSLGEGCNVGGLRFLMGRDG